MTMTARDRARIRVAPVTIERSNDECCVRVSAEATGARPWSDTITFRFRGAGLDRIEPAGDMAVATFLLPAMRSGARLEIASPASAQLVRTLPRIQSLYDAWHGKFVPVEIDCSVAPTAPGRGGGTGLFFSGGVDAFHTLLTTEVPLTHLVFIAGFDFHSRLAERKDEAIASARAVADARGLELVVVDTDFRARPVTAVNWKYAHGAALFAVALGLQGLLRTCLVSASDTAATVLPWGTHPELDPLWSTESMQLVHVGADVTRWEKIRIVGADPLARQHLRVCFEASAASYNCGRCNKCLLTGFSLLASGDLAAVETFPPLDPQDIVRIRLDSTHDQELMDSALDAFDRAGEHEMVTRLRGVIKRERTRRARQSVRDRVQQVKRLGARTSRTLRRSPRR
jgi:hypothetical protein